MPLFTLALAGDERSTIIRHFPGWPFLGMTVARRFRTGWRLRRWDANSRPSGWRIEQLNLHGGPVGQFWRRGVLTESMIREPYSTAVMAVSAENKELILDQILSKMRKMRHQHEEENARGIAPARNILDPSTLFLRSKHEYGAALKELIRRRHRESRLAISWQRSK